MTVGNNLEPSPCQSAIGFLVSNPLTMTLNWIRQFTKLGAEMDGLKYILCTSSPNWLLFCCICVPLHNPWLCVVTFCNTQENGFCQVDADTVDLLRKLIRGAGELGRFVVE